MAKNETPSQPNPEQIAAAEVAAQEAAAAQAAADREAADQMVKDAAKAQEEAAMAVVAAERKLDEARAGVTEIADGDTVSVTAVHNDMVNLFTSQVYSKIPVKTPMDAFVRGQLVAGKLALDFS